jgi:hypothetical protein
MIHLSVLSLISPHIQQQILHHAMALGHIPVRDCDLGRLEILPVWQPAGIHIRQCARVGDDGLLFDVADEAVADGGRDQVAEEEAVEEDALRAKDHGAHEQPRGVELEEGEEVHSLVEGFFEEGFDLSPISTFWFARWRAYPAVIPLHPAQTVQVPQHSTDHTGHSGYTF